MNRARVEANPESARLPLHHQAVSTSTRCTKPNTTPPRCRRKRIAAEMSLTFAQRITFSIASSSELNSRAHRLLVRDVSPCATSGDSALRHTWAKTPKKAFFSDMYDSIAFNANWPCKLNSVSTGPAPRFSSTQGSELNSNISTTNPHACSGSSIHIILS